MHSRFSGVSQASALENPIVCGSVTAEMKSGATYMRCLEYSNGEMKVEWCLAGAEGRVEQGSYCLMATGFHFCKMKRVLER